LIYNEFYWLLSTHFYLPISSAITMSTQTQPTTKLQFLTESELAFFNNNGYLVIPKFFSKEWIDKLKNRLKQLIDTYDPTEHQSIFKTDEVLENSDCLHCRNMLEMSIFFHRQIRYDSFLKMVCLTQKQKNLWMRR
jgi:hypothetical protein